MLPEQEVLRKLRFGFWCDETDRRRGRGQSPYGVYRNLFTYSQKKTVGTGELTGRSGKQ